MGYEETTSEQGASQVPYSPPASQSPAPPPPSQLPPDMNVMYVYAPMGAYSVPSNPTLLAVPTGQMVAQPGIFTSALDQPAAYTRILTYPRKLAIAATVLYVCTLLAGPLTQIASIAISLHLVRKKYIFRKRAVVIACAIMELLGIICIPSLSWLKIEHSYSEVDSEYYNYSYHTYYNTYYSSTYWGWIAFVAWGVFTVSFGIPRTVLTWRYEENPAEKTNKLSSSPSSPYTHADYHGQKLANATLATYMLIVITGPIAQLASIVLSLYMVHVRLVVRMKWMVIVCAIIELVGIVCLPAFSWLIINKCEYYDDCTNIWYGWIAILVWGVFALGFGIARIVLCWKYDARRERQRSVPYTSSNTPNMVHYTYSV